MKKAKLTLTILAFTFWGLSQGFAQWVQANTGLLPNDANSIVAIGNDLFAGTGNISGNGQGVYKSTDNGNSWSQVNNGLTTLDIRKIIVSGTTLYAALAGNGTNGGIFKSTDNGANWTPMNNGFPFPYAYSISALGNTLYASMAGGGGGSVYLSTDNGVTWTIAADPVLKGIVVKSIVSIGGNIIAVSDNNNKGVYLSTDNGVTWAATSLTGEADCLAIIGTTVFAATGTGVFKSTDNGLTWIATANAGGVIDNATALAVIGTTLIVGCPYSVYSSTDNGTTYTDISTGAGGANLSIEAFGMNASDIFIANTFHPVGIWRRALSQLGVPNGISGLYENTNSIYPNPFSNQLFINVSDYKNSVVEIQDIKGQLIQRLSLQSSNTTVNTDYLSSGVYLLKLINPANSSVQKFIKN